MVHDGCNYYFSGLFFALLALPPLTAGKMKMSKKLKNASTYHHFTQAHQNS